MIGNEVQIVDMKSETHITDAHEVETALIKRYEGINEFYLTTENQGFPLLCILVNHGLAFLHFIPGEGNPGFISQGNVPGLKANESTMFFTSGPSETPMPNTSVVPFTTALSAAKEFFEFEHQPRSVNWFEL